MTEKNLGMVSFMHKNWIFIKDLMKLGLKVVGLQKTMPFQEFYVVITFPQLLVFVLFGIGSYFVITYLINWGTRKLVKVILHDFKS